MNRPASEAVAALQSLRRDYRQRSLLMIDQLAQRLPQLEPAAALEEAENQLHKLAGSGGSFGYAELSRQARALEQDVRAQRRGGGSSDLAGLAQAVAALAALLPAEESPAASATAAAATSAAAVTSAEVLLYDANAAEAEQIASTLLQFGYPLRQLGNLEALRSELAARRPHALLLDLGADSAEAAAVFALVSELREQQPALDCTIYYLSAVDDLDLRLAAARADASGFFAKPIDPMQIVDRLEMQRQRRQAPRYRVLIVDDDPLLGRHHASVLEAGGFEVEALTDPRQALLRMEGFRPDLVLLDLYMPGCSGPELARVIRMHDEWLALPLVFLSAETDVDRQLRAASEGADDFLTKPIRDAHLVAALRSRCERSQQMAMLINRDSLTGLLKHSRIKEELLSEVARAHRSGQPLAVAMLDIDHFKRVNDRWGHPVGDQVIRALANLLRQRVRSTDRIGRYGGEEFLLVLPNCPADQAATLINDICARFKRLQFNPEGGSFSATLSAGVATLGRAGTAAELLLRADQALYQAKNSGRDRVVLADA